MNVLDLFSGIGGFSLGLERAGLQTTAFCEIDPYCRKVLARHWPGITIHDDIRKLDGAQYAGTVDVVCGGYPCQPFSSAGRQQGEADPRHLWPEMHRIIREARPRWVVAENVRGHVGLGFDSVAAQLEDDGFTVWPFIVPASAVGAPHRRDRLWILAHAVRGGGESRREPTGWQARTDACRGSEGAALGDATGERFQNRGGASLANAGETQPEPQRSSRAFRELPYLANADGTRPSFTRVAGEERSEIGSTWTASHGACWWTIEPDVGRVAHGVPNRVDRLRALGNAVVPQIPELIGRAILAYEQQIGLAA